MSTESPPGRETCSLTSPSWSREGGLLMQVRGQDLRATRTSRGGRTGRFRSRKSPKSKTPERKQGEATNTRQEPKQVGTQDQTNRRLSTVCWTPQSPEVCAQAFKCYAKGGGEIHTGFESQKHSVEVLRSCMLCIYTLHISIYKHKHM